MKDIKKTFKKDKTAEWTNFSEWQWKPPSKKKTTTKASPPPFTLSPERTTSPKAQKHIRGERSAKWSHILKHTLFTGGLKFQSVLPWATVCCQIHKLLIQPTHPYTHTVLGLRLVATGDYCHTSWDIWMDRVKCLSPSLFPTSPSLLSHFSPSSFILPFPPATLSSV